MSTWQQFVETAPTIGATFRRRHDATGKLCMLGTLRADGSPRISPIEPRVAGRHLWIGGMPGTRKLRDLERDPRFTLHTATIDSRPADGDAKVWGEVVAVRETDELGEFADVLFADVGIDIREQVSHGGVDQLWAADIHGASSIHLDGDRMTVHAWRPDGGERVARTH